MKGPGQNNLSSRDQFQAGLGQGFIARNDAALLVKAVKHGGQVLSVIGEMVGFQCTGHHLDQLREVKQLAHQDQFRLGGYEGNVPVTIFNPLLLCQAKNAGDASVGVLYVVDRVIRRVFFGQSRKAL